MDQFDFSIAKSYQDLFQLLKEMIVIEGYDQLVLEKTTKKNAESLKKCQSTCIKNNN
jgi:hypothetical protein